MHTKRPIVLLILDGWGLAPPGAGNAISQAKLTNIPRLWSSYPHTTLEASGNAVGLPRGEDGNTETGHLNLGAGRVVYQDLPRINMSIADTSFYRNKAFLTAIEHAQKHNSAIHLLGLIGAGGVHSNMEHLFALLQLMKNQQLHRVFLHLITDGRDSPPKSALTYIAQVEDEIDRVGVGKIASVSGRYFAMDRDQRWERTEKVYRALTEGVGLTAANAQAAVSQAYAQKISDEFIEPTLIHAVGGKSNLINDNDALIFFNYRIDRPRQLTKAFVLADFTSTTAAAGYDPYAVKYHKKHTQIITPTAPFARKKLLNNLLCVTMTEYEKNLACEVAFPPMPVEMPLGEVIANQGLKQLRLAETEKERFVTYYFNGLRELPYRGEDRIIVPSAQVATYDLHPQMSTFEITEVFMHKLNESTYDFIVINFANPDMVGHTGVIPAAVSACKITDECVGKIVEATLGKNGACVITGDHGNVEEMIDPVTGGIDTEHSSYPVPFICVSNEMQNQTSVLPSGMLADIAPTCLTLMGIQIPAQMTGRNLLTFNHESHEY